jgi:hypothetical protein
VCGSGNGGHWALPQGSLDRQKEIATREKHVLVRSGSGRRRAARDTPMVIVHVIQGKSEDASGDSCRWFIADKYRRVARNSAGCQIRPQSM